ncbi:hypothetical protein JMN32_07260 [Fulvivirga sp. 29W222]|uniref:Uncharacterized protein n=1 Tax=Fulvivirga marina TaxID=2494733 RepID=A0A937FUA2_9BACT|nr:hypothetical protein [Fulvivirga marina]MBL6446099.1 hypothetical protein [Fulvivirga marina]
MKYLVLFTVIIFIDGFTAYKVAESIHQIKYLKGLTDESWSFSLALANSDFYLVLVFGLSALITFELLLGHWLKVMDSRNSDSKYHKSQNELVHQKQIRAKLESEFADLNDEINLKKVDINNKIEEITKLKRSISQLESDLEHKRHSVQSTYEHHKFTFENITRINLVRVDNETFTFSIVYMLDRVSTFMRGWKDFLHEHFAVDIAIQKSRLADEQVLIWKSNNLQNLKEPTL